MREHILSPFSINSFAQMKIFTRHHIDQQRDQFIYSLPLVWVSTGSCAQIISQNYPSLVEDGKQVHLSPLIMKPKQLGIFLKCNGYLLILELIKYTFIKFYYELYALIYTSFTIMEYVMQYMCKI